MSFLRVVGSLFAVAVVVVGSLGVVGSTASCGGECTATEKAQCDDSFGICTSAEGTVGSLAGCQQCAKTLCDCYDKCGSDCNPADHTASCGAQPQG